MRKEKNFYTYVLRDPRDGMLIYVGKGHGRRMSLHWRNADQHANPLLRNVLTKIKQAGLKPLEEIDQWFGVYEDSAFNREAELIDRFGRRDLGTGILCNLTDGGEGISGCRSIRGRARHSIHFNFFTRLETMTAHTKQKQKPKPKLKLNPPPTQKRKRKRSPRSKISLVRSTPDMKTRQSSKIKELGGALIAEGCLALDGQARRLGLSRSTTWTILKGNHKASGLSAGIINRMLAAPRLPALVQARILEYIDEKTAGLYGHDNRQLRRFTAGLPVKPDDRDPLEQSGRKRFLGGSK